MNPLPPWHIAWDEREARRLEQDSEADLVVVGAGFTGLAAAYHAARFRPSRRIIVLEADRVGGGASGRTGGVVLEGTGSGLLPGTDKAIESLRRVISEAQIECAIRTPGCYNVARRPRQAIVARPQWRDSGALCAVHEEPGGDFDPGAYLSGLAHAAVGRGVTIYEQTALAAIEPGDPVRLKAGAFVVKARHVILATNALSLDLMGQGRFLSSFNTFAIATEPVPHEQLAEGWWADERPFYTFDLPYLWGRTTTDGRIIVGSGLAPCDDAWRACPDGEARCRELEQRLHGLHPAFADVEVSHGWWGPICFGKDTRPYLVSSGAAPNVWFVGGYAGHGVALSALLAEALARHLEGDDSLLREMPWLTRTPRHWLFPALKSLEAKASLALGRLRRRDA